MVQSKHTGESQYLNMLKQLKRLSQNQATWIAMSGFGIGYL